MNKSMPPYEVRDVKNLKQMVEDSCEIFKDKTAYHVKKGANEYIEIKYPQVLEEMNALRNCLN